MLLSTSCRQHPPPPPAALRGVVGPVEYANAKHVEDWLHHPVYGDPSFDAFEHSKVNPIHRGGPPFEWPVNGFFFADPVGGNWYAYVGDYVKGYWGSPSRCILFRSTDKGQAWSGLGTVLPEDPNAFDGNGGRSGSKPDVSVVYNDADHRYHMVYDWAKPDLTDGGIAHAWAEKPEGPFHRDPEPILRQTTQAKLLGKYNRPYAATLLRREKDWLILGMMDSPPRGWAMFAITAPDPAGPWSKPVLVRDAEGGYYHPPLMEFFPAFAYQGTAYAPATSVALNRDFQALFEAPLEQAHDPSAWKIGRCGSLWHSEDVECEAEGIWGQTFSGWVEQDNAAAGASPLLHAIFPSRDSNGMGTINLAQRPWDKPMRPYGFHLAGHEGQSLGLLRQGFDEYKLNVWMRLNGKARLVWDYNAPLGPDKPASGATLHPASLTRHMGLEMSGQTWSVVRIDEAGRVTRLATGPKPPRTPWDKTGRAWAVEVRHRGGGQSVWLSGAQVWFQGRQERNRVEPERPPTQPTDADEPPHDMRDAEGDSSSPTTADSTDAEFSAAGDDASTPVPGPPGSGAIGLLVGAGSHAYVAEFHVRGVPRSQELCYLYTEALLDAAAEPGNWFELRSGDFRWSLGAVSKAEGASAKWAVRGRHLALYSPKGPEFGTVEVWVDGNLSATIDLHADRLQKSALVWSAETDRGYHAVVLKSTKGLLPLDCLGAGD